MKKLLLWGVLLGFTSSLFASPAADMLWDKLHAIESMQASFTQKVYAKKKVVSKSTGEMALQRPNYFRWNTKKPMAQLLVADGQQFWLYDVDLEQVTVRPQAALEGAAAGLFLGDDKAGFMREFKVTETQKNGLAAFRLDALLPEANIKQMTLQFAGDVLKRMDLYDQLGQHTVIVFQFVKNNTVLSKKLFRFSPPKGVDVVKQ